ncbi:MAG: flotillin family protein [Bradymonadaceae bacterium]
MLTAIIYALVIGGLIFLAFMIANQVVYVGGPNELLVFSGFEQTLPNGQTVNYHAVHGGRYWRIPGWEEFERLDLTLMSVHIHIEGAYSKGGIPLNVHAIANVKVSSDEKHIHNAVERFLGHGQQEIRRVAKETLEGNVRSVLAKMTPEEVNENRQKFARELADNAEPEFEKLGMHIDTLKIQNVEDERDYLDSIGRKRIAEIIKVAEVAESDARKAAEEAEAEARGRGEVARRDAQAEIQKAQNELRELKADLDRRAKSEEERANARALEARAEAEQELQQVRTELEKVRLQADVVIPAEAEKVAQELKAQGEAAEIAEQGRALAQVLAMMADIWEEAGDDALDVFVLQRLESVMDRVAEAARQVQIRKAAIIDSGEGEALPNYVASFPKIVGGIFDELDETVGLDVGGAITGEDGNGSLLENIESSDLGDVTDRLKEAVENNLQEGVEDAGELLDQLERAGGEESSGDEAST